MKLPNWFRIGWWALLICVLGGFLSQRLFALIVGQPTAFDALALVLLVCLSLAPLFSEMSLFGFTLKQQIESVKAHVDKQVETLRADLHNTVDVRSQFSPHITFTSPPPPSDKDLPKLEEQVQRAVADALDRRGNQEKSERQTEQKRVIPPENIELFEVRFNIERELLRIWTERLDGIDARPDRLLSVQRIAQWLVEAQVITPDLSRAIGEVYAVCSAAVHGRKVSQAKVSFVRDVAPGLLAALREI